MTCHEVSVTPKEADEMLSASRYYHSYGDNVYSKDNLDRTEQLVKTGKCTFGGNIYYIVREAS